MRLGLRPKATAAIILGIVLSLPVLGQVIPKPEEILGFRIGDDYHLATYTQAIDYLRKVASVSDRIKLFDMGKTSMGQAMTYAVISSPANLADLEAQKNTARRLSLASGLSPAEAEAAAKEAKAIVYIDGGLHASECAPAQHNIQLAYNLVTGKDPKSLRILDDVILVLVFANPDGMNLLAQWYHPNVGTPFEISPMPFLYHKYAGHDNNRDALIANLVETRNLARLVDREWFPVIVYNHHQTAPFPARIWTPPNSEPTNPNVHPLIVRWQNLIGSAMGAAFDEEGKEGAISRIVFDTWYPGYMTQVYDSHNIISILTETALYEYATPHFYAIQEFPKAYQDLTMSAFYPNPWKGGWWRLRDSVDYCLTASMAVLDTASKFHAELSLNKYRMARDVMDRFRKEPPYAWIVPAAQADPATAALLLNRMTLLGIDVYASDAPFSCDGIAYPKGTLIIPMSQPYGLFVKNVFEEQKYPDLRKYPDLWQGLVSSQKFEGQPFESYDMMGWTLPYQFGIRAAAAGTPIDVPMTLQKEIAGPPGEIVGRGGVWALDHAANASATAVNRILAAGGSVRWAKKAFSSAGVDFPEGTILAGKTDPGSMDKIARGLGLKVRALAGEPQVPSYALKKPRLGVYQSWIPSEEEGWLRLVLEEFEFPFTSLHDAELRAGSLRDNYDVIIMPDHYASNLIVDGHEKGTMPPQYVGGIGAAGLSNLKAFAEAGGTIILMNGTSDLATDHFGLPARNILKNAKREEFLCSGSILRLEFDTSHPVAYGMARSAPAVYTGSCAFDLYPAFEQPAREARSVVRFPAENMLMSGYMHGDRLVARKSVVLDAPLGKGRAILLGFPVTYRAMPRGTFKLLFNSIFYGAASE